MPAKIWFPLLLILGGIGWLAFSNLNNANYFFNVHELPPKGDKIYEKGLKVKGRVVVGSIGVKDAEGRIPFKIQEEDVEMDVVYVGDEPLPDMFKDRAEAVVEGKMTASGVFEARHVQAKCASKYEAEGYEGEGSESYPQTEGDKSAPAPNAASI